MARGGRRSGKPGASYANRTDLNARPLPVTTAPGQAYGAATQQAQAQQAVPMASGDVTTPQGSAPPSHDDLMAQASAYSPPPVTPLRAPSQRPGEPLMTPPTAATVAPPSPLLAATAMLNSLGDAASPAVKALRRVTQAGQQNAGAP